MAELRHALNQLDESLASDELRVERLQRVANQIQGMYTTTRVFHSSTPRGKRFQALRAEDPPAAIAYAFAHLSSESGSRLDLSTFQQWRGLLEGTLERYRLELGAANTKSREDALEDLRSRYERQLGESRKLAEEAAVSIAESKEVIAEQRTSQAEEHARLFGEAIVQHEKARSEHEEEMGRLRTTFNEAMALRAPVEYWRSRLTANREKAAWMQSAVFWSLAVLAALVSILGWITFGGAEGKPDIGKTAVFVILGVVGVWTVRLIIRMYLHHAHLATDADERVTMVQTYLALLEGKAGPSDEDRKLVLSALFRPSSDGLVKDESLPHPLLELLTRTGQK